VAKQNFMARRIWWGKAAHSMVARQWRETDRKGPGTKYILQMSTHIDLLLTTRPYLLSKMLSYCEFI
jgi:hypothetical protein